MSSPAGYCTKCGAIRVLAVEMLNSFNQTTGERNKRTWKMCPMYRKGWFGTDNGHDRIRKNWYDYD